MSNQQAEKYKEMMLLYLQRHNLSAELLNRIRGLTVYELNQYFKQYVLANCPHRETSWSVYLMARNVAIQYFPELPEFNRNHIHAMYDLAVELSSCLD